MLVKSTTAWNGKKRGEVFEVNGNDSEIRALVAKGRLVKVESGDDLDALTGNADAFDPKPKTTPKTTDKE